MKKRKKIIICILCILIILILIPIVHWMLLKKDGKVLAGYVMIEGEKYNYSGFELTKEGKTIARIDGYIINEVPEDPTHTFLVIRSFLDQDYIVRDDYKIPEGGNVSCAYIGTMMERTTDEALLAALTKILNGDYLDGKSIQLTDDRDFIENNQFNHVVVGYEDCPVGTDNSIYYIGKIDSKYVVIFRDEIGEYKDGTYTSIYHEIDSNLEKVMEDSGFWK